MLTRSLLFILFLFLLQPGKIFAQRPVQMLRGVITDRESNQPLPGAAIGVWQDSTLVGQTQSKDDGHFYLPAVPTGRVNVWIQLTGYQRIILSNVPVNTAKETVLIVEMETSVQEMTAVEVSARQKGASLNDMALTSARSFQIEETERYAGSRNDPARMAANFAGVAGTDDSRNDLIIRGNSPFGVLYRIDQIVIPNPNHFAVAGATGGSVAILNNRMLANSDFLTGAFPSEFGNAIAGVFDIRFKNGNNEKYEGTAQFGLFGAEAFLEGPIQKSKKSSFIFNYRYATLELLQKMGIDVGTKAPPKYQDFQFKLNFPLKNKDQLAVFGIGGYSRISFLTSKEKKPDPERDLFATTDQDEYFQAAMGVLGITYTHLEKSDAYQKITLAASTQFNQNHFDRVIRRVDAATGNYILDSLYPKLDYYFVNTRYALSWLRNQRINARSVLRYGLTTELLQPIFIDSVLQEPTFNPSVTQFQWLRRLNTRNGLYVLIQPYVQWKFSWHPQWNLVAGLHGQYFSLNHSWSIEPRLSLKWQFRRNQSLALGTGLHSQLLPMYQYLVQNGDNQLRNRQLDFMRSFHIVATYDLFIGKNVRIKTEAYFQQLYSLPVDTFASSYNMLNEGSGFDRFFPPRLQSAGLGRNYGIELTVEKFFAHNWFILFSGSGFDSRLQGSDGKWYNSSFNYNYMFNLLGTKEFKWGKKRLHTLGIGGKLTFGGGPRWTPFDTTLSRLSEDPVVTDAQRNSQQFRPYFRFDLKLNYRVNGQRLGHEIGIDLVNLSFSKNILRLQYVDASTTPREVYQIGFLPLFYYRLDFSFSQKKGNK